MSIGLARGLVAVAVVLIETHDRLPWWGDGVDTPSDPVILASRSCRQLQFVVTGEGDRSRHGQSHARDGHVQATRARLGEKGLVVSSNSRVTALYLLQLDGDSCPEMVGT